MGPCIVIIMMLVLVMIVCVYGDIISDKDLSKSQLDKIENDLEEK